MLNILLKQQSGFTKCPCFLCMWDSMDRSQHYTKKDWPARDKFVPNGKEMETRYQANWDAAMMADYC